MTRKLNNVLFQTNGVDSVGSVISPPIQTSRGMAVPNYYRPGTSQQHGVMFYPPQYMMMPGGITSPGIAGHQMPGHQMQGHQIPGHQLSGHQLPSNYMMMPAGHMAPGHIAPGHMPTGHMPNSMYSNGHIPQGWAAAPLPGPVRSAHDLNSIRMPVSAGHISYMPEQHRTELEIRSHTQYVRSEQDTPPPGYAGEIMAPATVDS